METIEEKLNRLWKPKKTGLEIAYEALKKSHPNSPSLPYLDGLIKKAQNLNTINRDKKGNNIMEEETKTETPSTSETPTEEANQ